MLDEFVHLSFARSASAGMAPRLLNMPGKTFRDHRSASRPPIPPFHSDYLGRSVSSLASTFEAMVDGKYTGSHASGVFIVLDDQTLVDKTVCGICVLEDGVQTIRADFAMAIEILGCAEILQHSFDEGLLAEWYEKGEVVTAEGWDRYTEECKKSEEERRAKRRAARAAKVAKARQ